MGGRKWRKWRKWGHGVNGDRHFVSPSNRMLGFNGSAGLPFNEFVDLASNPVFRLQYVALTNDELIYEP